MSLLARNRPATLPSLVALVVFRRLPSLRWWRRRGWQVGRRLATKAAGILPWTAALVGLARPRRIPRRIVKGGGVELRCLRSVQVTFIYRPGDGTLWTVVELETADTATEQGGWKETRGPRRRRPFGRCPCEAGSWWVIALLAPQMHKPPAVRVQDDATRLCRGGSPHPLLLAYHVFGLDLCRRRSEYSCSAGAAGVRAREPCRPPHWGRRGTSARAAPTAASGRAVLRPRVETREIDREREREKTEGRRCF